MSIDISVQPLSVDLAVPTEEQIEGGANAVSLNIVFGAILPISLGPGQPPLPIPLGTLHVPVIREQGLSLAENLQRECEKLPKQSSLVTAESLQGVDKVAQFTEGLKRKQK